ncbi:glycosyl transferase family 2 [Gloeothece citriformis PCC 7424]|uniref:Glycosyl transferase family 2 n=1 Tax=Gloeothece citriformis (strain PCC 7424) TaxID=65393 RepID=B7KLJ5_GLOC7|nr:glycosyltransferase [Gloeothece citriformis]ACK72567.1 glycosyl transferase family 2 [Gloeothece citriformis PCC 7424]
MSDVQVTIVVSPRERFSYTQESLESIYQNTTIPFKLVYVDGNSPPKVQKYLQQKAQEYNFKLIRTDHYLCPNHARNLALEAVDTDYVAFVDNDVIVTPGWLKAMIDCAQDTKATVVGPLMCQHEPVHEEIHFAGGEAHIFTDVNGKQRLREKMYKQGHKVAKIISQLQRSETELCEFHCMLVRRQIFEQTGYFDAKMLNTKEHIDFCMTVRKLGGTVYVEPKSIVTYVPTVPLQWSDLHYYMLRWSDAWELASLAHLRQKWNLSEDYYFRHKYKALGWRRRMTILQPIVDRLTFGSKNRLLNKLFMYGLLAPAEKLLNHYLTNQYAKRWLNQPPQQPSQPVSPVMEPVVSHR